MTQTATILVIDDEPQIRKFLRISLASQGYKVLEAGTGAEGLAPDRVVDQPHGLVREAEDHLVMADDAAHAPRDPALEPPPLQELESRHQSETLPLGSPGSGVYGLLQSGALEESNVDLTGELVNMIVAQRNFQANSQALSTQDQITQAVINIR